MKYEDIKKIFEETGEPIILFDADGGFDWTALPVWGSSWRPIFTPKGISLPQGLISGPEDKRWFYPYSEISLVGWHGLKVEQIEEGELAGVTKTKVFNLHPEWEGRSAVEKIRNRFIEYGRDPADAEMLRTIKSWLKKLEEGDLSFVVVGDPLVVPFASFELVPSGILILQEDGTVGLINGNADLYMVA